jgi:hypothetical protein
MKAMTPKSVEYDYNHPDRRSEAAPIEMQVN